jgi:nucleoside-diphosphate-sugar epimerase
LDCQLIVGSILDRDFVREAMKGGDSVFHLAAMGSVQESGQKPNECAEIQCFGYSDCLEEAARADSRRHFVRARNTSAVCRTIAKRDRLVGWHRLQSVRERLQQPGNRSAATIFACKQSQLMMFLKKLRAFTIPLSGPHPEINLPNDGCANS